MKNINTIFDYMAWRGDLTFAQDPFNEVDSVILSRSGFIDFQDIVPPPGSPDTVTFREAMERFDAMPEKDWYIGAIISEDTLNLARVAAQCPRYADAQLFAYENMVDEDKEMQFAAVTFRLSDGTLFVCFRGTDDTIVGWKEDFNMMFLSHIPAQERSAAYLNEVAHQCPRGDIITGGHSKGGNLAIWSAVHAEGDVRRRLVRAYSNDGPGFTKEMLESSAYLEIRDKCMNYVPQSSLVGMLRENDGNYRIIYSGESALLQHAPFSWAVERNQYVYLEERSAFGEHSDAAMRLWLDSMTTEEKHALVDDLFEVLESTGAKTLTELKDNLRKYLPVMVRTISEYEKDRRKQINRLLGRLLTTYIGVALPETLTERLEKWEEQQEKREN